MDSVFDMATSKTRVFASLCIFLLQSCATIQAPPGDHLSLAKIAAGSPATVLVWWATQCPCVTRYQSRMEALAARYSPQGVSFFAIASNSDDSAQRVQEVAKQRGFALPILMDIGGSLASQLNVRTTPTVVITDATGEVRYRGWIDNERFANDPQRIAYVENALDDLLANRAVASPSSPIYGCKITKRLR